MKRTPIEEGAQWNPTSSTGRDRGRTSGATVRFSVEERPGGEGNTLWALFGAGGRALGHEMPLKELNRFPALRAPLAVAFAAAAARRRTIPARRALWYGLLSMLEFLEEQGQTDITPDMLDEDLRLRLISWLNRVSDGRAVLKTSSRKTMYRVIVLLVQIGMENGLLGSPSHPFNLDARPWRGQHEAGPAQEAFLDPEAMTKILRYCAVHVENTMVELAPLMDALEEGRLHDPVVAEAHRIRTALLASPDGAALNPLDARRSRVGRATRRSAARIVLPSPFDLTPFAILLAHYTTFNPATLFGTKLKDIESVAMGGAGFITIRAFKPRRGDDDEATFSIDDSRTNPDRLIRFIIRWTAAIREAAGSDLLWVSAGKHHLHLPDQDTTGFQPGRAFDASVWLRYHGLPHANLSSIRKGMRDLAHLASDGDRAAISAMGGQSERTIEKHYVSPDARRRERARVAAAADRFERWFCSDGKVDERTLPDLSDRTAATPGFSCMDNRASPITGMEGRACTAYGKCPICPLAVVDVLSPRSCGYLHLLLDRIEACYDASDLMTAAPVIGTWAPVARSILDVWLPAFTSEIHAAAAALPLPRLPDVE